MSSSTTTVESVLGFPPAAFLDEVSVAVDQKLSHGIEKLKQELVKIAANKGHKDINAKVVGTACDKLLVCMKRSFDRNLDKFDIYANRNIFVLPTKSTIDDNNNAAAATDTAPITLDSRMKEASLLKKKYLSLHQQYADMTIQCQNYELLYAQMKQSLFQLIVGSQVMDEHNVQPLAETMAKLAQQKHELLTLCNKAHELIKKMESPPSSSSSSSSLPKSILNINDSNDSNSNKASINEQDDAMFNSLDTMDWGAGAINLAPGCDNDDDIRIDPMLSLASDVRRINRNIFTK